MPTVDEQRGRGGVRVGPVPREAQEVRIGGAEREPPRIEIALEADDLETPGGPRLTFRHLPRGDRVGRGPESHVEEHERIAAFLRS